MISILKTFKIHKIFNLPTTGQNHFMNIKTLVSMGHFPRLKKTLTSVTKQRYLYLFKTIKLFSKITNPLLNHMGRFRASPKLKGLNTYSKKTMKMFIFTKCSYKLGILV